jgi:hypothetical protein
MFIFAALTVTESPRLDGHRVSGVTPDRFGARSAGAPAPPG